MSHHYRTCVKRDPNNNKREWEHKMMHASFYFSNVDCEAIRAQIDVKLDKIAY